MATRYFPGLRASTVRVECDAGCQASKIKDLLNISPDLEEADGPDDERPPAEETEGRSRRAEYLLSNDASTVYPEQPPRSSVTCTVCGVHKWRDEDGQGPPAGSRIATCPHGVAHLVEPPMEGSETVEDAVKARPRRKNRSDSSGPKENWRAYDVEEWEALCDAAGLTLEERGALQRLVNGPIHPNVTLDATWVGLGELWCPELSEGHRRGKVKDICLRLEEVGALEITKKAGDIKVFRVLWWPKVNRFPGKSKK